MRVKLTSGNRLTLPEEVLTPFRGTEYFDATEDNGHIVLTPVRINRADAARGRLANLRITEDDVSAAVAWAREGAKCTGQRRRRVR